MEEHVCVAVWVGVWDEDTGCCVALEVAGAAKDYERGAGGRVEAGGAAVVDR